MVEEGTQTRPKSQLQHPSLKEELASLPQTKPQDYQPSEKLRDKIAVITGGDSGIGRAVAVAFAREGADIAVIYFHEHKDAQETRRLVEQEGRKCILISGDIGQEELCEEAIQEVADSFGRIDILVNNAGEQHPQKNIEDISAQQFQRTFQTNIFSMFYMTKAALGHMKVGSSIINSAGVTAYRGCPHLLDYSAAKGAVVAFTRSLALNLSKRKIRVNAVAPGPIWTPSLSSALSQEKAREFASDVPMGRPGEPNEVAPCYVFLACDDSSYMTGQTLHPNGGEIVNG